MGEGYLKTTSKGNTMAKIALENFISRSSEVKDGLSATLPAQPNGGTRVNQLKITKESSLPAAIKKERLSPEGAESLLHEILSHGKVGEVLTAQGVGLSEQRVQELLSEDV